MYKTLDSDKSADSLPINRIRRHSHSRKGNENNCIKVSTDFTDMTLVSKDTIFLISPDEPNSPVSPLSNDSQVSSGSPIIHMICLFYLLFAYFTLVAFYKSRLLFCFEFVPTAINGLNALYINQV